MHGRSLDGCLTGLIQGACRVNSGNQWRGRFARAIPPHKYQYEEGDRVMYVAIFFQDLPGSAAKRQAVVRSEEHTSELQSLMRISYAVFCLKKTKQGTTLNIHQNNLCH